MGFLLIFDITNEKSFLEVQNWIEQLKIHAYCDNPDIVLCGNKLDMDYLRVVNSARARSLAEKYDIPYIETSASTGWHEKNRTNTIRRSRKAKVFQGFSFFAFIKAALLLLLPGENINKAVEMLLDKVMLRMENLSLPGRLPINLLPSENGHGESSGSVKLEHASEKTKCNC